MRAYVQIEYSADGTSPARVEAALRAAGFRREGIYFITDGEDLIARVSELHAALQGTGVRYTLVPNPSGTEQWSGTTRDVAMHWREDGLIDDAVLEMLSNDPAEFRKAALLSVRSAVEKLAAMREREIEERRTANLHRAEREDIIVLLRGSGGMTARQVLESLEADEDDLASVLAEMVRDGELSAEQSGHSVVYRLTGPRQMAGR